MKALLSENTNVAMYLQVEYVSSKIGKQKLYLTFVTLVLLHTVVPHVG